jgi:hypothetical protein
MIKNVENYRTYQDCEKRYPRLIRAMCWAACLSTGEAACAIRDFRHYPGCMGGEAVAHYGGPERAIREAIRHRHTVTRMRKLYATERQTSPTRQAA